MFGLVLGSQCMSLAGSQKHFLFLEVMGLKTDEVNELMTPQHLEKWKKR